MNGVGKEIERKRSRGSLSWKEILCARNSRQQRSAKERRTDVESKEGTDEQLFQMAVKTESSVWQPVC